MSEPYKKNETKKAELMKPDIVVKQEDMTTIVDGIGCNHKWKPVASKKAVCTRCGMGVHGHVKDGVLVLI